MDAHLNEDKFEQDLRKTLEEEDIRDFRQVAREAMEDAKKEKSRLPILSPVFVAMGIAASLLILIAAIWWWQVAKSTVSVQQLANTYLIEADPGIGALDLAYRDEVDDSLVALFNRVAPAWKRLDSLYTAGDYRNALAELDQLKVLDPGFSTFSQAEWMYYTGMCQLHMGETKIALATLEQVTSPFLEKASFFRAIALLKLDRKEEAKPLLESIAGATTHPFKEPAGVLLKRY